MGKLLLSWVARAHDFVRNENGSFKQVAEHGPHCQFYKHFYKQGGYDKHLLLYSSKDQEQWVERLENTLLHTQPEAKVETRLLELKSVISLDEIKPKIEDLLVSLREHEIDIFFSPGTSIMQLSWFICHQTLGFNTRLIQTSEAKFNNGQPKLEELSFQKSQTPLSVTIKQFHTGKPKTDSHFRLTPSIMPVYKRAEQVAQTDRVTVMIRGESGTGKEHLAKHVHLNSSRREGPFMAINCSALSENLLESRLFGYAKGAFTGADKDTPGVFEQANGGTIFLDEIGHISPQMQQALLRVLQEREIQPIGDKPKMVDVRVIAATNAPLEQMCQEGTFRWDLYYRLAVAELELPPLCDRGAADFKVLLDHFVQVKKVEFNKPKLLSFSGEALAAIKAYTFPGNVRELENLIESLYVFCEEEVQLHDLPKRLQLIDGKHSLLLKEAEKAHIMRVFKLKNRNITHTMQALGISKNNLKEKLRKYGVIKEGQEVEAL
ncbi:sigma-54-dependent Fis family transcriptional regulator [Pontibacter sp. BAB1700]|uniref:sigma-54 interaction domain-containing protein n=1 Tax=Pontibacter sp. BAB1700 TaxID=1144253 RepID=UPI00026BD290|nr:sigma-54 dependent transcriptional regulator [Pontibacter sp. BAB1700]EJF08502.1 two component, sigma54 specific, Fis family transcriptional regulator [Pontibacter sp. BAB1700]